MGKSDCLEGYSDASLGDCKGSITTSGFLIKLYGDTIAWKTRRQRYVALSTCQAEYVAMSVCCQELISIHNSLRTVVLKDFTPMKVRCDNRSAEANVKTGVGNKLRHMTDIKEHYVRECAKRQLVNVEWVASKDQIADILTKPLPFDLHMKLTNVILNKKS